MENIAPHIEALIFCAEAPIALAEIKQCLEEKLQTNVPDNHIKEAVELLMQRYEAEEFAIQIRKVAGGYCFRSKNQYEAVVSTLLSQRARRRLSKAALETLAVIAYKQPVTKSFIEQLRGVGCDYSIQKLLDKELIIIKGKDKSPGRPLLYGTSEKFMHYFGIDNLNDLPLPQDVDSESPLADSDQEGTPTASNNA
ncbi:MAG: SMC-Scp complex subunit ScpB [Bernardetiaceae bacterium]|nr:SMC-Scp complex subunit ScpB [Bernardetiaceae bacterium]